MGSWGFGGTADYEAVCAVSREKKKKQTGCCVSLDFTLCCYQMEFILCEINN